MIDLREAKRRFEIIIFYATESFSALYEKYQDVVVS